MSIISSINSMRQRSIQTVVLPYRLDFTARACFDSIPYNDIVAMRGHVYLDFSDVAFIDSSGLGALLLVRTKAKEYNLEVFIFNLSEAMRNILELAHFEKMFVTRAPTF